ncbi:hypothetical protein M2352_005032 [Azospirillum fermentarium]|uniref:hypothetical protein n=1 Tax=Azospirillum fermentarium TaxID=1233114 RepID=UPI0022271689|nr:hypothetical protein [Azospirillum fermentarium]MCW2249372.1 hypothetical protein [Azospirillum fermentarium]
MSETVEDSRRKFADLVKLNGMSSKYIERDAERRVLEDGVVRLGLCLDEARGVMRAVAEDNDFVFESDIDRRIRQVLDRHAGKKGKISRQQFEQTASILRDFSNGAMGEEEARSHIKQVMIDSGWKPRRAGLIPTRRWYNKIET